MEWVEKNMAGLNIWECKSGGGWGVGNRWIRWTEGWEDGGIGRKVGWGEWGGCVDGWRDSWIDGKGG